MSIGNEGWIVSLWIDTFQLKQSNREHLPYLSWSPYDRVTIYRIDEFSKFFNAYESVEWNGLVQRLHLVPMGNCNWQLGQKCLIDIPNESNKSYGIYCIVTARYEDPFEDIIYIEEQVYRKINENLRGKKAEWQAFYSLGVEDFVGIFLADSIEDLASSVDVIKQITYTSIENEEKEVFTSVYSFLGLNNPNFEQEPKADLLVKLYLKPGYARQEVCQLLDSELRKVTSRYSFNEIVSNTSCIELFISNNEKLLSFFHNQRDALFNGQSDFYKQYIENSRTYWCTSHENILSKQDRSIGIVEICMKKEEQCREVSRNYNISPVSRFILTEYKRMINSRRCLGWKSILQQQYEVYAMFVKEYTDSKNETALCELNNNIQTVLLHINQATAPIYEIPYHNYYYSGSYNDILKMYYGIIGAIFNIAFNLPRSRGSNQHMITYCVDYEAATKVHSKMYTLKNSDNRFVVFHLPYEAFMRFDKTVKLLFHEVFHYVAPYNRKDRNFILIKLWIISIFEQYSKYLEEIELSDENMKNITQYFYGIFGEFCKIFDEEESEIYNEFILNDFTLNMKWGELRKISEKICEKICNQIYSNCGLWLDDKKDSCTYKAVYSNIYAKDSKKINFIMEDIRKQALAAKEAFCDLNMIYALKLSLYDYICLLYDQFLANKDNKVIAEQLDLLIEYNGIKIGSFELRIGMVLNYYLDLPEKVSPDEYKEAFKHQIQDVINEGKDERPLFAKFCEYLAHNIYRCYLLQQRMMLGLHKKLFKGEVQWFALLKGDTGAQKILRAISNKTEKIANNISNICNFKFIELVSDDLNRNTTQFNTRRYANIKIRWNTKQTFVSSLGQYVEECCKIRKAWKDNITWFRGVCNEKYDLTPSLFRYIDSNLSLYANQARFLKAAYYATLSDVSLWSEQLKSVLEHMSFLQHYGMPTSLLDFTDDMLMALHFALNPDDKKDLYNVNNYISQPKVVLFNPIIYNDAVISLHEGQPIWGERNISTILLEIQDKQLEHFYVQDMSTTYLNKHSQEHVRPYVPEPRTNLYPCPIAIPRSNDRVNVQNGMFVAYNLSARYNQNEMDKKKYYSYLALEVIQKDYMQLLRDNPEILKSQNHSLEDGYFIKEIFIDKMAIDEIKKQLIRMNITTSRVYPEYFRIFGDYKESLVKHSKK